MNTVVAERVSRQHVETLRRLASKAEQSGSRILRVANTERHVASSATHPVVYEVSVEGGCSCRGYTVWRRCGHHSLLLAELGLIADVEDVVVDDYPADRCRCGGQGYVRVTTGPALADWLAIPCSCQGAAA